MKGIRVGQYRSNVMIPLILFCLFAILATAVTAVSARAYQRESQDVFGIYNTRTATSYVTEKVRQSQGGKNVEIADFAGGKALRLSEKEQGHTYYTYIYAYDGQLLELYQEQGGEFEPSAGSPIIDMKSMEVSWQQKDALEIICRDNQNHQSRSILYVPGR